MDESEESTAKTGWGELGPKWITAIAALLTALGGLGFVVGRTSAPSGSEAQAPATTVTVTQTVREEAPHTGASEPATPAQAGAGDYWAGELTWRDYDGDINLDLAPPKKTGDRYIAGSGNVLESYGEAAQLTVWKSDSVPGKDECKSAADAEGTTYLAGLVESNYVCGTTFEGRVFRLEILSVGNVLRAKADVWER